MLIVEEEQASARKFEDAHNQTPSTRVYVRAYCKTSVLSWLECLAITHHEAVNTTGINLFGINSCALCTGIDFHDRHDT